MKVAADLSALSFRLESKRGGLAHVVSPLGFGSAGYALCGVRAKGITVTQGQPCPRCIAAVVEEALS